MAWYQVSNISSSHESMIAIIQPTKISNIFCHPYRCRIDILQEILLPRTNREPHFPLRVPHLSSNSRNILNPTTPTDPLDNTRLPSLLFRLVTLSWREMVGASKFGRLIASTQKQQSLRCKQREKQCYTLIESSLITLSCFWGPCSGFSTLTPASQIIPIELGVVESRQEKSIICCVNTVRHEQFYWKPSTTVVTTYDKLT